MHRQVPKCARSPYPMPATTSSRTPGLAKRAASSSSCSTAMWFPRRAGCESCWRRSRIPRSPLSLGSRPSTRTGSSPSVPRSRPSFRFLKGRAGSHARNGSSPTASRCAGRPPSSIRSRKSPAAHARLMRRARPPAGRGASRRRRESSRSWSPSNARRRAPRGTARGGAWSRHGPVVGVRRGPTGDARQRDSPDGRRSTGRGTRSRKVSLPALATPLALAFALFYYGFVAGGAAATRMAPRTAQRLSAGNAVRPARGSDAPAHGVHRCSISSIR